MQVEAPPIPHPTVFLGPSASAERLRLQVARFAPHFRAVLLVGEAHTGKRDVARELHRLSPVAALPFRELHPDRMQAPEASSTLYLPHLEQLSLNSQEALPHLLEQMPRDLRLIAACEADPRGLLAAGRLRPALYQHLGMLELRVVPLRERLDDLPALIAATLARHPQVLPFTSEAAAALLAHTWPGNLAELARVCARQAAGEPLHLENAPPANPTEMRLDDVLHRHVMDVLERCAGNKLRAAELLGISRSTLYRMLDAAA